MWLANGACLATLAAAKQSWGPFAGLSAGGLTLGGVWAALAVFMWVQVVASVLRVASGTGRWRAIRRPTGRPTGATSVSDSSREASRVAKLRAEVARVGLAQYEESLAAAAAAGVLPNENANGRAAAKLAALRATGAAALKLRVAAALALLEAAKAKARKLAAALAAKGAAKVALEAKRAARIANESTSGGGGAAAERRASGEALSEAAAEALARWRAEETAAAVDVAAAATAAAVAVAAARIGRLEQEGQVSPIMACFFECDGAISVYGLQ
jgi:hypothetical protein